MDAEGSDHDADYSKLIGQRLRAVRRQKAFSLHEVEAMSGAEFKASVLGAYERGERAISVPRLHRLSRLYGVATAALLPADPTTSPSSDVVGSGGATGGHNQPMRLLFDVAELPGEPSDPDGSVRRYVSKVQILNDDLHTSTSEVSSEDLSVLARLLGTNPDRATPPPE
jgi:hypothetical protein